MQTVSSPKRVYRNNDTNRHILSVADCNGAL